MSGDRSEVVVSARLEPDHSKMCLGGWQEVRICDVLDSKANGVKHVEYRLKAVLVVMMDTNRSYGEVSVWASSSWKQVLKVGIHDLPEFGRRTRGKDDFAAALEWLFKAGSAIVR